MNTKLFEDKLDEIRLLAKENGLELGQEMAALEKKIQEASDAEAVWRKVELARHPERPYALDYINKVFTDFIELHGDRAYGDDGAIVGGLAFLDGRPVTVIANQKGRTIKDNFKRNYGMANPEGYRKAVRLALQAEKFGRPIITFVDTGGAYPGLGAEERGIGEAIARSIQVFSQLKTIIICFVIGEGGSGGALGICVGDKIYILENAIYSVISPEGYASLLLRDAGRAKDAAALMKITSADLMSFKLVNGVIPEPPGGAQTNPDAVAQNIRETIKADLQTLGKHTPEVLTRFRNAKIRLIGRWKE